VTVEASVLATLGSMLELLTNHGPRACGDEMAHKDGDRPMLESRLGVLDKDRSAGVDAAVYQCCCGWVRYERLSPPGVRG